MKQIYLDYAAATPVDPRVIAAMQPYFTEDFYNPSATYLAAQKVRDVVEAARKQVASVLGARSAEVIFMPGATAANAAAIQGILGQYPGKRALISAVEHPSVLHLVNKDQSQEIPVQSDGAVDLAALERLIDDDTVLISVMYANNEVGTIEPLREIGALAVRVREHRRTAGNALPLYLHSDASQAANYLDLHVSRLGVDLMVLNGAKVYGPKQMAILYVRSGVELPFHHGTDNVPSIVGFAAALDIAQAEKQAESARLLKLQTLFIDQLQKKIPNVIINGSLKKRLPSNVHITIPGQDNERLLMALDEAGIMAAAGSACLASSEEPSHVLKAMGISDADAQSSLRFTMGRGTTESDVRRTVDTLAELIA